MNNHKEYYTQFLPSILEQYARYKVPLDNDLAVLGFNNCIERSIENSNSYEQLYNTILLIFRY